MDEITAKLLQIQKYFESGATRPYSARKERLQSLKQAIKDHEEEIYAVLYADLKKSKEESYATELGLVYAELNNCIKHLRQWMEPVDTGTDILNLPSKSTIYKDPLGVVLIISPWNYPFQLLFIPMVGAIAAGNCVVLKPSETAPATEAIIEKIITKTFQVDFALTVKGEGAKVVPAMINNFRFDHIFYTGSTAVGKSIYKMAAEELVPVTLELGGKSPCIVEEDANLTVAAKRITMGKFINAGQTCIAPDYLLVHEKIMDQFISKMKSTIDKFYTNDPSTSYDYGKIISAGRFDKLVSYLSNGHVVHGGDFDKESSYIAPTLLTEVSVDAAIMQDEIFGPILPIISYKTMDEALAVIKKNPNPLAFYLFTSSNKKEEEWMSRVAFGGGCVNNTAWHFTNHHFAFGGIGESGIGAYHGKHSFDLFTHRKPVLKTPTWFDPAIKYPGFKGKLGMLKLFIK
ncbi:MAG: aldehyde dehydrogenase [Chitinophagaceae bacterium]